MRATPEPKSRMMRSPAARSASMAWSRSRVACSSALRAGTSPRAGRGGQAEPRARPAPPQLDDVAVPQHRLLDLVAGEEGPEGGAAVEEHDVAVALVQHGVAGGEAGDDDVDVRTGADGGGQAG